MICTGRWVLHFSAPQPAGLVRELLTRWAASLKQFCKGKNNFTIKENTNEKNKTPSANDR
jgi:hypothetical protein